MKEWESEVKKQDVWRPITLGRKTLYTPYLAFADDLAILIYDQRTAKTQIEILKQYAEKVGLQISFEKSQILTIEGKDMLTKYGEIIGVTHFRYWAWCETCITNSAFPEIRKLGTTTQSSNQQYYTPVRPWLSTEN